MLAQIEALLAQDPAPIEARAAALLRSLDEGGVPLVLYGAGTIGREVLRRLRGAGLEPLCFADDTPGKQGSLVDGLPVLSPSEAALQAGGECAIAVTIVNPALSFTQARERLAPLTRGCVLSAFELVRALGDPDLPLGFVESPGALLARAETIRETARLLRWDPGSLRQLAAHLRFRLHLDFDALPPPTEPAYFAPEVMANLPEEFRFIDCGAYDGDTIRDVLELRPEAVRQVVAFEPDRSNHERLAAYVASLPAGLGERIELHERAVGERTESLWFDDTGNPAARLAASGSREVEVVPLDRMLAPEGAPLHVKLDVEGAEEAALRGAGELLRAARPLLAICVYHRPADLWEIPRYVASLDLGYRLMLRSHGADGSDLVLYALPAADG